MYLMLWWWWYSFGFSVIFSPSAPSGCSKQTRHFTRRASVNARKGKYYFTVRYCYFYNCVENERWNWKGDVRAPFSKSESVKRTCAPPPRLRELPAPLPRVCILNINRCERRSRRAATVGILRSLKRIGTENGMALHAVGSSTQLEEKKKYISLNYRRTNAMKRIRNVWSIACVYKNVNFQRAEG